MKAGDLIKFTKEHWNRPGFDYTKNWIGIYFNNLDGKAMIFWTVPGGDTLISPLSAYHNAYHKIQTPPNLEIISESR